MPDEAIDQGSGAMPSVSPEDALLLVRAHKLGVSAEALTRDQLKAVVAKQVAIFEAEIRLEMEAYNAYVGEHGSLAELLREHYAEQAALDDAV